MSDFDFRNQQRTFDLYGYARNPSEFAATSQAFVGDLSAAKSTGGASFAEMRGSSADARQASRAMRRKRKGRAGDASIADGEGAYLGPWGGWEDEAPKTEFVPAPDMPVGHRCEGCKVTDGIECMRGSATSLMGTGIS